MNRFRSLAHSRGNIQGGHHKLGNKDCSGDLDRAKRKTGRKSPTKGEVGLPWHPGADCACGVKENTSRTCAVGQWTDREKLQ